MPTITKIVVTYSDGSAQEIDAPVAVTLSTVTLTAPEGNLTVNTGETVTITAN